MTCTIVYTDLDGTLLDHDTYRFDPAKEMLARLKQQGVPVILCSSKTRAEMEVLRTEMKLEDPFICENGGAVFIPGGTPGFEQAPPGLKKKDRFSVKELGTPYGVLTEAFQRTKAVGTFDIVGFCEMTTAEIARCTGLSEEAARLAARREYSEPFICRETREGRRRLEAMFRRQGLQVTRGGRFFHLTGNNDKGRAVAYLNRVYARGARAGEMVTIGLGDSANDFPMLREVDKPVIIRKKSGQWEPFDYSGEVYFSRESGPKGWAEAVAALCFAL